VRFIAARMPAGMPMQSASSHRDDGEFERRRKARGEFLEHDSWVMVDWPRSPCTAFQRNRRNARDRPVEAEFMDEPVVALLRHTALADICLDRVARQETDQPEDEDVMPRKVGMTRARRLR